MTSILLFNLCAVIVFMVCVWLVSVAKEDASIVDIVWGLGFVLLAWLTFGRSHGYFGRKLLILILVTLWGLRLATHIFLRSRGKGEDPRYAEMRKRHGNRFWFVSLFTVFLLQGVLLWIIALVIQVPQFSRMPPRLTMFDFAGVVIWCTGFLFESVGDWQLTRFLNEPSNKDKLLTDGLWAYTRHPNYFGESLIWWGFFAIAVSNRGNIWLIVSPLVITFLLLRVSGVTLLKKSMVTAHTDYEEYKQNTSAFIPWFPKTKVTSK
jgi:steroid 5-alpha reductase family enzyme